MGEGCKVRVPSFETSEEFLPLRHPSTTTTVATATPSCPLKITIGQF